MKFPDGFPAARIELKYRSYAEVAPGAVPRKNFKPTEYVSPEDRRRQTARNKVADEGGEGGREHTPTRPVGGVDAREREQPDLTAAQPEKPRSEAEKAAAAMEVTGSLPVVIDQVTGKGVTTSPTGADAVRAAEPAVPVASEKVRDARIGLRLPDPGASPTLTAGPNAQRSDAERPMSGSDLGRQDGNRHEDQATRELRDGFATQRDPDHHHRHHGPDHSPEIDDDMDMGM